MQRITRRYRCQFAPATPEGLAHPIDAGILPFVDVDAPDAESAQRQAHIKTGKPIVDATRIEVTTVGRTTRVKQERSLLCADKATRIAAGAKIIVQHARPNDLTREPGDRRFTILTFER
jgi:hypothetical protein